MVQDLTSLASRKDLSCESMAAPRVNCSLTTTRQRWARGWTSSVSTGKCECLVSPGKRNQPITFGVCLNQLCHLTGYHIIQNLQIFQIYLVLFQCSLYFQPLMCATKYITYPKTCEIFSSERKTCRLEFFGTQKQLKTVAYAENFQGGGLVQGHMVVICFWCALFVTSQFDVISMFPNQRCAGLVEYEQSSIECMWLDRLAHTPVCMVESCKTSQELRMRVKHARKLSIFYYA